VFTFSYHFEVCIGGVHPQVFK